MSKSRRQSRWNSRNKRPIGPQNLPEDLFPATTEDKGPVSRVEVEPSQKQPDPTNHPGRSQQEALVKKLQQENEFSEEQQKKGMEYRGLQEQIEALLDNHKKVEKERDDLKKELEALRNQNPNIYEDYIKLERATGKRIGELQEKIEKLESCIEEHERMAQQPYHHPRHGGAPLPPPQQPQQYPPQQPQQYPPQQPQQHVLPYSAPGPSYAQPNNHRPQSSLSVNFQQLPPQFQSLVAQTPQFLPQPPNFTFQEPPLYLRYANQRCLSLAVKILTINPWAITIQRPRTNKISSKISHNSTSSSKSSSYISRLGQFSYFHLSSLISHNSTRNTSRINNYNSTSNTNSLSSLGILSNCSNGISLSDHNSGSKCNIGNSFSRISSCY
ncbi:hypothetical protein BS50DRAFT_676888 [Corynespora cassiicola Philippines]|uniref:Uncharacterized protein n=1 Tax=Corynespora cassiicola Philippines TaxID=1448308 RepID=A0A2T2NPF2_CORCC|nr:hypothetical protein BS50DRAFT_676888 [Corynespora cassiicola Philippines]